MAEYPRSNKTLDRDLRTRVSLEQAAIATRQQFLAPSIALAFIVTVGLVTSFFLGWHSENYVVIAAAAIGAYMALNIGANDVANNVGPAVGAKALSIFGALIIAVIFESAGALLAGGDVVGTISKGIIDPAAVGSPQVFIWAMFAALLSAAVWINLATWVGAPVSTTHSIVGGVMGGRNCSRRDGSCELAQNGSNCSELGYFTRFGWSDCRAFLVVYQITGFKQERKNRSSTTLGTCSDRNNGRCVFCLPCRKGPEKDHQN